MSEAVTPPRWYRVVDRDNQGWHQVGAVAGTGPAMYSADYGFKRDLADRTFEQLAETRSPLRPVEPITNEDQAELRRLFAIAGRKTITTLAAAVESVFHEIREIREARGGPGSRGGSWDYANRTLKAGREGSWESELLTEIICFGNGLNLASTGRDVAGRRESGPSKRVNPAVRDEIAQVIRRWVTDCRRYTEVAETLAAVVSGYCDDSGGRDGWRQVADQWLQPGGLAQEAFSVCYRLFYSVSAHFDSSLI